LKILIDINHPAHVHYFKNLIKLMIGEGHSFLIISRNKECEHELLENQKIPFISRGEGAQLLISKILYYFKAAKIIYKAGRRFNPDYLVSCSTPYPAFVAYLLNKPHISITDTESAYFHHLLSNIFSDYILTPICFKKELGRKHLKFTSYMELAYLSPNYFKPDKSIIKLLGMEYNEKFVVIRHVSRNAVHDQGHNGITLENKVKSVNEFSKYARVFISSEMELPDELKEYEIDIPPERMHDVLAFATLFYGESATMASECACLGTPAIYLDNDGRGYTDEEEDIYGLVFNYSESEKDQLLSIKKGIELLKNENIKKNWQKKTETMISDKIDVTAFFVWFFENYPSSGKILKENSDYQLKFN